MGSRRTRFQCGFPSRRQREPRAFTLVELLTVMAIMAILATITFGVVRGVKQRAAVQRARAELGVLAQALAGYREHYGDYPAVSTTASSDAALHQALLGRLNPGGQPMQGRALIASNLFQLSDPSRPDAPTTSLLDPWGRPYQYIRFQDDDASTYVLYSAGPDGKYLPPVALNAQNRNAPDNLDNIYASP